MEHILKQAIEGLGIDVPIMAVYPKGDDLVICLYGGKVVTWPLTAKGSTVSTPTVAVAGDIAEVNHPAVRDLEGMEAATLRDLARRAGIETKGKKKAELIAALRQLRGKP